MSDRERLLDILAHRSFRLGQFQLSSGGTSDYYIDCRTTTLDAEGALYTGRVVCAELRKLTPAIEAVGGLTLGADPVVVSTAVESARDGGPPISGFLVRKAEKAHGTGKRIEGTVHPGQCVAIVDDVCTTAASTINALEAAWQAGLDVRAVLCLVEREEAGGRRNLDQVWQSKFNLPCPFTALFTARDVRRAHEKYLAKLQ